MANEQTSTEIQPVGLQHSESLCKLTAALAKAESEFLEIKKACENPFYGNRYADLASLIEATRPALSKYELAVIQIPQLNGTGAVVTTLLSHSSGEWLRSDLKLPASKFDAQGIGSAITYARRYSYQAILNIAADDDDDGNAAVGKSQDRGKSTESEGKSINGVQQRALLSACKTGGRTAQQLEAWLANIGLQGVDELSQIDYTQAIKWALNKQQPENLAEELEPAIKAAKSRKVQPVIENGELKSETANAH